MSQLEVPPQKDGFDLTLTTQHQSPGAEMILTTPKCYVFFQPEECFMISKILHWVGHLGCLVTLPFSSAIWHSLGELWWERRPRSDIGREKQHRWMENLDRGGKCITLHKYVFRDPEFTLSEMVFVISDLTWIHGAEIHLNYKPFDAVSQVPNR